MALEPAIALTIGFVVLDQAPKTFQYLGIACVIIAGVAAERTGHRDQELPDFQNLT